MKIRDFELKDETVLEIGKFAVLWNWFEKRFCHNNCNYRSLEKAVPYVQIDVENRENLANALKNRMWIFEEIIHYVEVGLYPENAKKPKNTFEAERQSMIAFMEHPNENTTIGCLMTIYRIRCNMMHGLKIVEQLDDQYELFKAVNGVLESVR